jgi:hypothetical protein
VSFDKFILKQQYKKVNGLGYRFITDETTDCPRPFISLVKSVR